MFVSKVNTKNTCLANILQTRGFTLMELLVTISIFVILTGVVLFNQGKFNSSILLTNLAYDTALTVRQAQTYGLNIKEFNIGGIGKFVPYGVHFNKKDYPKSFVLFADLDVDPVSLRILGNGLYDGSLNSCSASYPGKIDGCVTRYTIPRGNFIKDICEEELGQGVFTCSSSLTRKDSVDIVFVRPNPDAYLRFDSNVNESTVGIATIILSSGDGSSFRKVEVRSNGLIEILN